MGGAGGIEPPSPLSLRGFSVTAAILTNILPRVDLSTTRSKFKSIADD
jgi:hypothetical protein